jgi:hypothetical protein
VVFERKLIRKRIKDRRGKGAAGARRPKFTGHQRKEAIARREAGETLKDLPGPTLLVAFNMTL